MIKVYGHRDHYLVLRRLCLRKFTIIQALTAVAVVRCSSELHHAIFASYSAKHRMKKENLQKFAQILIRANKAANI